MKSKNKDRLASGQHVNPYEIPPKFGDRCPRCHSGSQNKACLLCRPDLIPPVIFDHISKPDKEHYPLFRVALMMQTDPWWFTIPTYSQPNPVSGCIDV